MFFPPTEGINHQTWQTTKSNKTSQFSGYLFHTEPFDEFKIKGHIDSMLIIYS